ncbi:hypothetical protein V8E54_013833 [Elaphomyces granulatus]
MHRTYKFGYVSIGGVTFTQRLVRVAYELRLQSAKPFALVEELFGEIQRGKPATAPDAKSLQTALPPAQMASSTPVVAHARLGQDTVKPCDSGGSFLAATLDDWSGHVDPNDAQLEREVRNEQVHGGSIAKDVAVIAAYEGKARGSLWKDAFQVSYGVNYDAMKHVIKNVPDEILVMLNRRCSAKRLASWQKKRGSQAKKIIEYADDAISLWAQRPETSFCTGSRGYELLRLIEDLWHGD